MAFSAAHEGLLQPEACSAFCFSTGQGLAALSEQGWCLCGAAQPSSASFACLSFCSGPPPPPAPDCGGPTLLQHVFPASPGAALMGPHGPLASGQLAAFYIAAPLPVTATRWDFGDGSPEVDAAGPAASHRYVLPGRYHVTAVVALGVGSALLGTNVQVEAAPAALELVCPSSVQSDESLKLSIQNRGGSGLEAAYSIVALGEELARGECLLHTSPSSPGLSGWGRAWYPHLRPTLTIDTLIPTGLQWCTRCAPRTQRSSLATGTATAWWWRRQPGCRHRSSAGPGPGPPWPWWTVPPCSASWSPGLPGACPHPLRGQRLGDPKHRGRARNWGGLGGDRRELGRPW